MGGADCFCARFVFEGVAYEDVVSHISVGQKRINFLSIYKPGNPRGQVFLVVHRSFAGLSPWQFLLTGPMVICLDAFYFQDLRDRA